MFIACDQSKNFERKIFELGFSLETKYFLLRSIVKALY